MLVALGYISIPTKLFFKIAVFIIRMKTTILILSSLILIISAQAQQAIKVLSMKGYGGNNYTSIGNNITKTVDGGFILPVSTNADSGSGNIDSWCSSKIGRVIFIKYTADGTSIEWTKCNDGNYHFIFPANSDGYVYGDQYGPSTGWGFRIAKENVSGVFEWNKDYSKGKGAFLRSMIPANDGGYILFGQANNIDTNVTVHYGSPFTFDFWVLKVDSVGDKVWSKIYGGSNDEYANTVVPGPHGGSYIFGMTESIDHDCISNHGGRDVFLARLDSNGNLIWKQCYGGTGAEGYFGSAVSNGKGGIVLTTDCSSTNGDVHHHIGYSDFWAVEIDSNSNIVWENSYGSFGEDDPKAICKATDGSIWIAGTVYNKSGNIDTIYGPTDGWIVHADSVGNFINAITLGTHKNDEATMLFPLPGGLVMAGGSYDTSALPGQPMPTNWYNGYDIFIATLASWPVSINPVYPLNNSTSLNIYPNPTNNIMNIIPPDLGIHNVLVTDLWGREIFRQNSGGERIQVNVSNWREGMYCVYVTNSEGYKWISKVLIQ